MYYLWIRIRHRKGEERRDVAPGTAWEDVPDDFRCPLCGAVKNMFKAL